MKREKVSQKNKPMLYITQPDFRGVDIQMQKTFKMKAENRKLTEKEETVDQKHPKTEEVISSEQSKIKMAKEARRRKRLTEMNPEEKIIHLLEMPKKTNIPRAICEVGMKNGEKYKGIIIGYENGEVRIRTISKVETLSLKMSDINAVTILGF